MKEIMNFSEFKINASIFDFSFNMQFVIMNDFRPITVYAYKVR